MLHHCLEHTHVNVRQALEEDPLAYSSEGERAWRVCACVFLACVCVSVCLVCVLAPPVPSPRLSPVDWEKGGGRGE